MNPAPARRRLYDIGMRQSAAWGLYVVAGTTAHQTCAAGPPAFPTRRRPLGRALSRAAAASPPPAAAPLRAGRRGKSPRPSTPPAPAAPRAKTSTP
jgi:hypothetical protein